MSQIFCTYDQKTPATKQCDECYTPLCSSCGYTENGADYCNNCWKTYMEDKEGKCFSCGSELEPIMENNGFTEPAGPSHWEITGYKPCKECKEGGEL